ncbi:MAG: CHASE domain-containing protein [Lysobacterales bacterium]
MADLKSPFDIAVQTIGAGKESAHRHPSLHWMHWFVVGLSTLVTIGSALQSNKHINDRGSQDFTRQSDLVIEQITERMAKYEDALWAGVAVIQSSGGKVTAEQWAVFEEHMQVSRKYPGISGIGVILPVLPAQRDSFIAQLRLTRPAYDIYPRHNKPELFPIVYIEPTAANRQAVGLDVAHETQRLEGIVRARESGRAEITGPIVLVQDSDQTPGFLFYAPYYRDSQSSPKTWADRELVGFVYAPFIVKNLLAGTLGQSQRRVSVRISDEDSVIYDEGFNDNEATDDSRFSSERTIELYGRTWRFDMFATPELVASHASLEPLLILLGGLSINGLLLALFILLTRSNRRAQKLAARMTLESRLRAKALQKSNEELEKFAYIASHDLKAPLRAIKQLANIIYEDCAESLPQQSLDDLKLLVGRTKRMDSLLNGLLDYSRIGDKAREPVVVDVVKLIEQIADNHAKAHAFTINYVGPIATVFIPETVAQIVFSNLIANAIKHHDQERITIRVSYQYYNGFDVINFTDNGPGIDFQYRHKIFEMFQTLKPRDEVEGNGMGLALVKKTLKAHGGEIELIENEGRGASFRISFLRPIHDASQAA